MALPLNPGRCWVSISAAIKAQLLSKWVQHLNRWVRNLKLIPGNRKIHLVRYPVPSNGDATWCMCCLANIHSVLDLARLRREEQRSVCISQEKTSFSCYPRSQFQEYVLLQIECPWSKGISWDSWNRIASSHFPHQASADAENLQSTMRFPCDSTFCLWGLYLPQRCLTNFARTSKQRSRKWKRKVDFKGRRLILEWRRTIVDGTSRSMWLRSDQSF